LILQSPTSEKGTAKGTAGKGAGHEPERLRFPGVLIRLDAVPLTPEGKASATATFDAFVTRSLARGAGAISTHLSDPSLADVTRPTEQLMALARGDSVIEAHFKSVPQLGGINIFVGDPLLALPEESIADTDTPDQDRDGIEDAEDNCRDDANPDQRDSNRDGVGNLCDADVDDDGQVDTSFGAIYPIDRRGDLESISLTALNGPYDEDHDLDGNGSVDERDLVLTQLWLFRTPGRPALRPR
jgi:hypothetical protein